MDNQEIYETLSNRQPPAPLYPSAVWQPELSSAIEQADFSDEVRTGLLLWNDDLDGSHTLSQSMETPTGSLWHAVMHRREGDASNSIYWWRRTGEHPAFATLYPRAVESLKAETNTSAQSFLVALERAATWLPEEFVREGESGGDWCVRLQHQEFAAFLDWCRASA